MPFFLKAIVTTCCYVHLVISTSCYNHPLMTKLLMTTLKHIFVTEGYYAQLIMLMFCFCNPAYLPPKSPICKPLTPEL